MTITSCNALSLAKLHTVSLMCSWFVIKRSVVVESSVYVAVVYLPPIKEEVNAIARDVCLSVSKITQKRVHGFG